MIEEFNTEFTHKLVCPWCGHKDDESWAFFEDGDETAEVKCERCEKPYYAVQHVEIVYSTRKVEA